MFFPCGVQCDQKGIIDIAMSKFPDINNLTLSIELFCDDEKIVQVFPLSIQIWFSLTDILLKEMYNGQMSYSELVLWITIVR